MWHNVKRLLSQQFGNRGISCHFPFPWPPRSPDLTPLDFWLVGYMKSKVCQFHPLTVSDLKDAIRTAIQDIPIAMIRATVISTNSCMQSVIVCEGDHVENL